MDENKLDVKLASFYAKVKKLVTDYMTYCDQCINKVSATDTNTILGRITSVEKELGDMAIAVDTIILVQDRLIGGEDV